MTAMIAAASQQNPTKKIEHRLDKKSDTLPTTRSDKSLKERYEKLITDRNIHRLR
jgi:hypothetical protein